jgi:capsular polysaccharide biosynthesis protein
MPDGTEEQVQPEVRQRRWLPGVIIVLTLLLAGAGGAGAAAYNESRAKVYRSTAVMFIDQEPALTQSRNDGLLSKLVRLRLKYADIVTTTVFSDPLADTLSLPPGQVHAALSAVAPPSSMLMSITATTGDPAQAERIATAAAQSLHDNLQQQQTALDVPESQQVTLNVVTPARPGVKTSPRRSRSLLLGIGVAVAILVVGGVLADATRRRR